MTRVTAVLFACFMLALSTSAYATADPAEDLSAFNPRLIEVAEHCRATTVGIVIPGGSMGSGVIIDDTGLVMTAAHVLPEPGSEVVIVLADGRQVPAIALGVNREVDSGMARITEPGDYTFAEVAPTEDVWEGDWCIAFGHGGGVQTDRPAPMRLGRVLHVSSSTSRTRFITTDCTVISGDSGGPLFDLAGRVIGIHSNIGMNVLVNRHVPIAAYHAQWDQLLEQAEIADAPQPAEPLIPGLEDLPDGIQREIERRLSDGDEALLERLEALRNEEGEIELSPEQGAELLGRQDLLEELRTYQQRVAERDQRSQQIEDANEGIGGDDEELSDVAQQSLLTRALILDKRRERLLNEIAEDLRHTHGKIAEQVLARFDSTVVSAGPVTAEVLCRGQVVALGTVIREDGYILTKASELVGPVRVRVDGEEYPAMVVNGNGPNDLALLKINAQGLQAVTWVQQAPALGSLLIVPDAAGQPLAMGVVSVDARVIPQSVNNVNIAPPPSAYLGIADLQPAEGQDAQGIVVGTVVEDSPAAQAGLQPNDIVLAIDGNAIENIQALIQAVQTKDIGQALALTVLRDGESIELQATLGTRPEEPVVEIDPAGDDQGDDSQSAAQVYSARGGELSNRRTNFPLALTHDAIIWASDVGGPVLNLDGQAIGINIARYGRTATYTIPAGHLQEIIDKMIPGQ